MKSKTFCSSSFRHPPYLYTSQFSLSIFSPCYLTRKMWMHMEFGRPWEHNSTSLNLLWITQIYGFPAFAIYKSHGFVKLIRWSNQFNYPLSISEAINLYYPYKYLLKSSQGEIYCVCSSHSNMFERKSMPLP